MGEAEAAGCKRFRLATLGCKKDLWKDAEQLCLYLCTWGRVWCELDVCEMGDTCLMSMESEMDQQHYVVCKMQYVV